MNTQQKLNEIKKRLSDLFDKRKPLDDQVSSTIEELEAIQKERLEEVKAYIAKGKVKFIKELNKFFRESDVNKDMFIAYKCNAEKKISLYISDYYSEYVISLSEYRPEFEYSGYIGSNTMKNITSLVNEFIKQIS